MTATERNIVTLRERIRIAEADLARMPEFKRGTYFETSRIENLDALRRSLARIEILVET